MKNICLAGALGLMAASANAGTIDFTDESSWTALNATQITGSVDGISWIATANGGSFNTAENAPVGVDISPLVGDNDGLGITDDEVSFPAQSITLRFANSVNISLSYFLDLFMPEQVHITSDTGDLTTISSTIAFDPNVDNGGFNVAGGLDLTGLEFTFFGNNLNDPTSAPDFALAGLEVASVPLPAGMLLLGGALGALGVARRRKTTAA